MTCTNCGVEIQSHMKYLAFFQDQPNGGMRIEVGCAHYTPPDLDEAVHIAGGGNCAILVFTRWMVGLTCKETTNETDTESA
jgi:hypothetical protein